MLPKSVIAKQIQKYQKRANKKVQETKTKNNSKSKGKKNIFIPVSSSMTSIFVAWYLGQSADPMFKAAQGLVTVDFLDVACRLLLSPIGKLNLLGHEQALSQASEKPLGFKILPLFKSSIRTVALSSKFSPG